MKHLVGILIVLMTMLLFTSGTKKEDCNKQFEAYLNKFSDTSLPIENFQRKDLKVCHLISNEEFQKFISNRCNSLKKCNKTECQALFKCKTESFIMLFVKIIFSSEDISKEKEEIVMILNDFQGNIIDSLVVKAMYGDDLIVYAQIKENMDIDLFYEEWKTRKENNESFALRYTHKYHITKAGKLLLLDKGEPKEFTPPSGNLY